MGVLITALVVAAVSVGGVFGQAEATTVSRDANTMVVALTIEVPEDAQAVMLHMGLGGETRVLGMLPSQTPGLWAITTEVEPKNWQVAFEVLGPTSAMSQVMTLAFLGADIDPTPDPTTPDAGDDDASEARRWGFLGLAFGAASLSLLAFWVLGAKDDESSEVVDHQSVIGE